MSLRNNIKTVYFSVVIFLALLLLFVFILLHKYAYNSEKQEIQNNISLILQKTLIKELTFKDSTKIDTNFNNYIFFKDILFPSIQKNISDSLGIEDAIVVITTASKDQIIFSSSESVFNKWDETPITASVSLPNKGVLTTYIIHYHIRDYNLLVISNLKTAMFLTIIVVVLFIIIYIYVIKRWIGSNKESKLKDDFFQNITHELKTPIATTSIAIDIFKKFKYELSADKTEIYINIIREENRKMKQIVERLLSISVIENSASKMTIAEIDIHELLKKESKNFQFIASENGGSITTQFEASEYIVKGDYSFITMIFTNLLDNALKYSPTNPIINITTRSSKDGIYVTITDNGIGIPNESISKIFNKTYRIKNGFNIKGFGLGLYFVKQLVEIHKGKITATSELNKGSKFTVYLPFNNSK